MLSSPLQNLPRLRRHSAVGGASRQRGVSLVVTLLMIVVVASLASAAARFALNSERSGRGDRDRELAFQAAETALADGERDVLGDVSGATRSADFCWKDVDTKPFPDTLCGTGSELGKCAKADESSKPNWLTVDWDSKGVPVGTFTGGNFYPTQGGTPSFLSINLPKYVIEKFADKSLDEVDRFGDGSKPKNLYLVTAIGYGSRTENKVVLQSILRKTSC